MPMPALESASPADLRALLNAFADGTPTPVGRVENCAIDGPASQIKLRIYRPERAAPAALLVYLHGGGWVLGNLETHDETCRRLCVQAEAVVVAVDYRLAPEAKYPAALEDCYAALCQVAAQAANWAVDAARLCVAGDSAGGNLAAAVSMMARDRGGPALAHQLLIYPVTDCNFETASYRDNAEGYFLTRAMMRWFWDHYLEHPAQRREPLVSPLHGDLAGLPAATVITAGYDPLRDEGSAYAEALRAAGVAVEQRLFAGMIHGFVTLPGGLTQTDVALEYLCARLRAALP